MKTKPSFPLWIIALAFAAVSLAIGFSFWRGTQRHAYPSPELAARMADAGAIAYHTRKGLDVNERGPTGRTLLELVAARQSAEERRMHDIEYPTAKLLLGSGADPNAESNGTRPLIVAATLVKARLVKLLLDSGADPTLTDALGRTALMQIGSNGAATLTIAAVLLERGADPRRVAPDGYTALRHAEHIGREDLAELLRRSGAVE